MTKRSIINCHTHIFTGDHVPPWLAKTFVPWPFYYLLPVSGIVWLFRKYYNVFKQKYYEDESQLRRWQGYDARAWISRQPLLNIPLKLAGWWLTLHALFILIVWAGKLVALGRISEWATTLSQWLIELNLLFIPGSWYWKILIVLATIIIFKSGRNLILFLARQLWHLPGPQTKKLLERYILLGRFSFHGSQSRNYQDLRKQYPEDSGMIVLPMDMEFMGAGKLKKTYQYHLQMDDLADIKEKREYRNKFFPFVFVDPRRMAKEKDFFRYSHQDGTVMLDPCFVRDFIEVKKFSGFKIYPALGYYPFDTLLLPLWKYAADNGFPILTHCIRGNIFYRGKKIREWDHHPVFTEQFGEEYALLLPETSNIQFINNFTHPMNFLCLLKEPLLRKVVDKSGNDEIKALFGYTSSDRALQRDLSHLKICFGHYGGEDEWKRFFELDRDNYSSQIEKKPDWGIDFLRNADGDEIMTKLAYCWRFVDWYSIISSIMLQHDKVYSDLSFILHDPHIQPLLHKTLENRKLRERTLFGTDFYVVRNYKTEKQLLAEMMDSLTDQEFDQIARINPRSFLANRLHGPVAI